MRGEAEGPGPSLPRALLRTVTADPQRLPELLAAFSAEQLGSRADRSVSRLRGQRAHAAPADLRAAVVARGRRRCQSQGAFVGGPFLLLVPVAFCSALLAQFQMALELACLAGRDPEDPARAAELLVLQGVHPDTARAQAVLTAAGVGQRAGAKAVWQVTWRMARLLGLITPEDPAHRPSRWRRAGNWLLLGVVLLVGMAAPLVWLPYLGRCYRTSTIQVADRAVRMYFGDRAALEAPTRHADPGRAAALLRAVASVVIAVALLLWAELAGMSWPVVGLALIGTSVLVGAFWYLRRRSAS